MATSATTIDLGTLGIFPDGDVHRNLSVPELVEQAMGNGEGMLVHCGAFRATTGERTGRLPDAKFTVADPSVESEIWWGPVNKKMDPDVFERMHEKVARHLSAKDLYVFDGFAGADPRHRLPVRIVNETAWHNLFVHQLFLRPSREELRVHEPGFTILHAPSLLADPAADGTNGDAFVLLSFERRLVLIGGTEYAGEVKKSIFTVMNYLMPKERVLPMHCSANVGPKGDVALFFGLSGTGKTTLSADPDRGLIGDDEHGWSERGVFNFEGGSYAKTIHLTEDKEPLIWAAIRFGSVLENVVVDEETRQVDYDDDSITENTRAGYPVDFIPGAVIPGVGGHPRTVVFLTADAFGVLPPISRLTREQAMYHFISGYTAKVAGTEAGVTEPKATFSACFGAPFLPLHPTRYAEMLGQRLAQHDTAVWLVNTGWTGGPYGTGHRMKLRYTRSMVTAALTGELDDVRFHPHPVFGVEVPESVPHVPDEVLDPRSTWADGEAYDAKARELAGRFRENFEKFDQVPAEIAGAGPRV
ncbi:MAG TPA: phosphoenolpyruvate carboxykinase (ATP) [Gemmatimonadota bacterium]|nr:phosphoenolpyruvate carboxykinase (ATP) [Gemmatimonadota bacterium]